MACLPWIPVLLLLHGSHSYILLTANLDDVQAIAKQIAVSPVGSQLSRILRRASTVFNQQVRAMNDGNQNRFLRTNPQDADSSHSIQDSDIGRRSQPDPGLGNNRRTQGDQVARRSEAPHYKNPKPNPAQDHETTSDLSAGKNLEKNSHNEEHNVSREHEATRDDKDAKYGHAEVKSSQAVEPGDQKEERIQADKPREEEHVKRQSEEKPREDKDTRSHTDEVVALGKNASYYLNSIKKIMENV